MPYKDILDTRESVKRWKKAHPEEVKVQKLSYRQKHYQELRDKYRLKHPAQEVRGKGRVLQGGYVMVKLRREDAFFSPMTNKIGWIMEHRLIMAKFLNRCLLPWEVIHHKNGERDDNRLENLELLTDRRWHMVDLQAKAYIKRLEREIAQLKLSTT